MKLQRRYFRRAAHGLSIVVLCFALPTLHAQPAESDVFYSANQLLDVKIELNPEDWERLRVEHRPMGDSFAESPFRYYEASVTIDGTLYEKVGVRKKGFFGSVVSTKPSLKIRFDRWKKKQRPFGLDQLTLNNNIQDASQLNQFLAYSMFRKAGVAAPRCNLARVTVNGTALGVYSNVESIRRPFLRRCFSNAKGILYEGYAADFDDMDTGIGRIESKSGDPDSNREPLLELQAALNQEPLDLEAIEKLVDIPAFITFWATEVLIGHWDSYSGNTNNYYVYRHGDSGRLHFIPWGADSIFLDPGPFISKPVPKSVKAVGVLCRKLWSLPEVRELYRAEMRRLLTEVWNEKEITDEIARMQKLLGDDVAGFEFNATVGRNRQFIATRRTAIGAELTGDAPEWPDGVTGPVDRPPDGTITLTGSFDTTIGGSGKATLTATEEKDEEPTTFESVTATAAPERPFFIRPEYPVMDLVTKHPETGRNWYISFVLDPIRVPREKPEVPVDHFAVWVMFVEGQFMSPDSRTVFFGISGKLTFEECALEAGGALKGTFELEVPVYDE